MKYSANNQLAYIDSFVARDRMIKGRRPRNRHRILESPHYTIFGFAPADHGNRGEYLEHWFMHIYVDNHDVVTGIRFKKSTTERRRLTDDDMTFLCVSHYSSISILTLLKYKTSHDQGPYVI